MKVLSDLVTYINNLPPTKRLILIIIVIVIIVFLIDFVTKSMKSNYRNVTNHSIENMDDGETNNSNTVSTESNENNNTLAPSISAPNMLPFREVMMNTDILNMTLLEGLSPYNEKMDISTYVATNYMKNKEFFIEEMDFVLDEYYNELIKKIPIDIIEKYKNIELLL